MTYSRLWDDCFRETFITQKELQDPDFFTYLHDDGQLKKFYDDEQEWNKFVLREMDKGRFYV